MKNRLLTLPSLRDEEEEEEKKKLSGLDRLNAASGKTEEPAKKEEPTAPEQQLSGMDRLNAAREKQEKEAAAPQVSNTYRQVDKEKGRIRTRPADLSAPSWQDDPEELGAETKRKGSAVQLTQNALGMAGAAMEAAKAKKQAAEDNVSLYAQSIQKYQGILADESASIEDKWTARKNLEALKPMFSNLQTSARQASQAYDQAESTYNAGKLRLTALQDSLQQTTDRYVKALGLGEAKAKEYDKQAQSLRSEADKQYRSGQANYQALRQAEDLEAKAANSRGQYASYLAITEGEEAANKYAAGEREKEETAGFGKKVVNTIAGLGANFFSGIGGASMIMMSRLMELPEDALYAITKNEAFNLDREPYLRDSKALEASDPFRETANELKERAGSLGGKIIDTGYAAGSMMGVGGLTGQVTGALANTGLMNKLTSIAESSQLLTSPAARRGAQMAVNALRNPGNLGVSLSSGVNSYSEALASGASFSQAMANGLWKGLTEYVSNKMFSGTPLEDIPGEKGYVTKAIEFVADKLGKSDVLRALNQKTGGKVLNWLFDKAGEGMEEVITGVFDPIIDRLTYDTQAEWAPKLDALTDEFIGGVLLSLLMTGGEAAMTGAVNLSTDRKIADYLVENWGIEQAEARKYAPQIRKALKATQDATEAVRQEETPAQQTTLARIVQKVTKGEALTGQDARRILADPEAMRALTDGGYLGGKVSNDSEGRKEIVAAAEQYAEDNANRGIDNATERTDNATARTDNATQGPPVPEQGLRLPAAEEKAPVQESKLRLKGTEEIEAERDARAIQEYVDFANSERAAENNAQIGAENAQNPEKSLSGIERLNAARERAETESKTVQRTLATERQKTTEKAVSLRDAGFATAAEEATARIRAEESWDAEEKAVGQALRDLGYEPTFAVGLIQNAEGDTVPFLADGNKIAIRADHRSQSIQQIAENAVGQSLNIEQGIRTSAVEAINQAKIAQKAPETPKVTPRAQAVLDSAREAGASQEDSDLAARLSDMLGFDIRFFNDAGKNGARKNGYFENGTLYINTQSNRTLPWIVGHELTHGTEASRYYDSLKKLARKTLGLNWENKVQSKLSTTARAAERLGDESVRVDRDGAEREVVADFFADRLLTDEAAIRAVCEYQPTTARGIRDYIKKLLNKLGGKQSTLEKAVEMYNKALKDVAAKAQAEAQSRLKLKSAPEAKAQGSGLKIGGKTQNSAEHNDDSKWQKTKELYDGRNMATDDEIYTYDFLTSLPPTETVYVPNLKTLFGGDGTFTREQVIEQAQKNAREFGTEENGKIYIKNNYTGKDLRLDTESVRHGLKGDKKRLLTNARMSCKIGEIAKNAVPINGLVNESDNPAVEQTYAMVADTYDHDGHEYIVVLTIERQNGNIKDMETLDVIHAVNARNKNGSRAGTKPQGVNPSTTTEISIGDLLKIVNSTHQTLLSKDVYDELNPGNTTRPKGLYTGKTLHSVDVDEDAYNRTALVTEDTVDKWLKDYAAKSSPKYAQAYITRMTPKQFVDLTASTTGRLLIGNQTEALDAEKLIEATRDQPLQIQISDGEVVGHEGRHRATALSRAGVDSIPVLVFDYSNKYSKTDVPEMTLQGQVFGHSRSYATETLRDLIPLSYENRDRIVQEYGTQPATERLQEKYNGRKTVQFSAEDSDDEYRETAGTPALEKLGIRLAGSKGKYHLAEQLLERDKAAKELMRATKKAEKKLNATKAEKEFAAGIAAGIYEERDIPKSMNRDKVTALADYYAAEDSFKTNMLADVRDRINGELKKEAEDLLLHGDFNFKKLSMLQLNERTPDRTFRAMFGTQKGKEIFDWLIRAVQMNESEKTRWHQKQLDRVRKFLDAKGKTRSLTRDESALTMLVMEGKAAAAAVADMEKKGLDAKGIRNAAENIRNGQDAGDAAQEFGLKNNERELAKNYATWMDTQEKLKNADSTIIEAAAEKYSKIFDEMYDAINDFLTAHGYEPIGYIKGYAPHMQPEETQNLLEKAFDKMGIDLGNDKAQGLPASIAGETAYFKPNKRWDPYFLHRTGTQAQYDIEKAHQSYVGYLSDILYHTDDIMRVRNFEKMLRKTYAPDEIREDLDMIQVIRDARPEDRQGMLRNQGKIGKTTQLSAQEVSEKLDEWEESLYNALKEDRNYNNLVMWLSNYANILAGKQSFADRGWEYSLGRNSLNFANRLQAAFQRSLVAGSLSSAINQTAQLPMIKTELGDRWYYKALTDILTGKTKGFHNDSDFLTTKHGVDMLTTDNYDKFINAIFTPSNLVDNLVSTVAVRGAYLKNVSKGMSYNEAMRAADDFGRKIMGSREKGTRPLAYESKGLFSRMVHMFQVEAANSWDHIASDLPYEIKEIAKTQGKTKAATTLAALLIRGLLSAFLLNRATEEIYGGTPAPFDVIGLAMNFVASGQGMTTNRYLKTIIDNGLEKIGSDRFFGTEDVDTEFDVGKGLKELGYNVMNDVPLLRNLAGVLGLGDQTVPLPGAGGEIKDAFTAAGDLIKEGADGQTIENMIRAAAKLGAQFAPAGRQITKTAEGIEAAIRGGSYNKKGNLQYPIDDTADKVKAILFGKNATNAAQEHWASGEGTMSEKQTGMVTKLRGQGMTGAEAQDAARTVKSFSGDDKRDQTVAYIDRLNITDSLKDEMYFYAGYKESTLNTTPWHNKGGSSGKGKTYAPADTSQLQLPPSVRMNEQDRELWDMESHGGNVNLRTRKTIPVTRDNIETVRGWGMDSNVGDYMTVASQTYRDGNRAIVVTPILPNGKLMTQAELDDYMDSLRGSDSYADADDRGIILGVFDEGTWQQNLKESDAFAERIHELHEEREEQRKTTGLKLPSTPKARTTSSLRLNSTPAAKPTTGGLRLK